MRKKACTKCGLLKGPQSYYWRKPGQKMTCCKECIKAAVARRYAANPEKRKAYWREYNKRPERRAQIAAWGKSEAGRECKRIYYRFNQAMAA